MRRHLEYQSPTIAKSVIGTIEALVEIAGRDIGFVSISLANVRSRIDLPLVSALRAKTRDRVRFPLTLKLSCRQRSKPIASISAHETAFIETWIITKPIVRGSPSRAPIIWQARRLAV